VLLLSLLLLLLLMLFLFLLLFYMTRVGSRWCERALAAAEAVGRVGGVDLANEVEQLLRRVKVVVRGHILTAI